MADDEDDLALPQPASKPVFDVVIGTCGADCRISVNGQDITRSIIGLRFECHAGELTKATLVLGYGASRAIVQAALDRDHVVLEDPLSQDEGAS